MCLYPRLIRNPKYKPNKKNGGKVPKPKDTRLLYVPIGCGQCIECRTQKARQWQVRLNEELKNKAKGYFVTLTFTNENLNDICNTLKISECNAVCGYAIRHFLERWRKKFKRSLRHWFITELGHNNTERIHIHGIIFTNELFNNDILQSIWKYGITYTGNYCNERTINYVVKYVTKIDTDHKGFIGEIFCSAGLGSNYINDITRKNHKYTYNATKEHYTLSNGTKLNLPIYYRNKLFTEAEREKLYIERLNKHERYVRGIRVRNYDTPQGEQQYQMILENAQRENSNLGYGDLSKEWQKKEYNVTAHMLNRTERINRYVYRNANLCKVNFAKIAKKHYKTYYKLENSCICETFFVPLH